MRRLMFGSAVLVCALGAWSRAQALTTAFIDFENTPSLPQAPDRFSLAGNEADITVPGVATISGGVVLGDETNLPALSYGTAPNVYGTAVDALVNSTFVLPDQITITIAPGYTVDEVSFPLFNGATTTESYTIDAFNGSTQVGQVVLSDLASDALSGHGVVDLTASDITKVVITPSNTASWDYSIDSIAFNEPVSDAINPNGTPITQTGTGPPGTGNSSPPPSSAVPAPPAAWSALVMLGFMGLFSMVRSGMARKSAN